MMFRKGKMPPFAKGRQTICFYAFGQTDIKIQEDIFAIVFRQKSKDLTVDILRHWSEVRGVSILCTVDAVISPSENCDLSTNPHDFTLQNNLKLILILI
jgi:hypothetical protein